MPDEIGYQNADLATTWAQLVDEAEKNTDLQWPKSVEVFDQMRIEDAQIGSVLRAVTLPIRAASWRIDPAGARDEVVRHVADDLNITVKGEDPIDPIRTRDRFSWAEHLRLALLELVYGHAYFEQVYRPENGREHLKKLAYRPPRTIGEFVVAKDGGLVAIKQKGLTGPDITIPVNRLVAYVNDREGGQWQGRSLLRGTYKPWLLKDDGLRVQSMTLRRNGLGVPVYTAATIPDTVQGDDREKWVESERQAGLKVVQSFRAGEAAGVSIPPGAKLELIGVTGDLPDTDKPIRYYDEQIARAVLAHFLNLGTETGSWALGSTFADFFTGSLNAVAKQIADITQQHVIEDLVDLNWGPTERAPKLVVEPIGSEFAATAEAIKSLIEAGVIRPDDALETYTRSSYGLPMAGTPRQDPAPTPTPEET